MCVHNAICVRVHGYHVDNTASSCMRYNLDNELAVAAGEGHGGLCLGVYSVSLEDSMVNSKHRGDMSRDYFVLNR